MNYTIWVKGGLNIMSERNAWKKPTYLSFGEALEEDFNGDLNLEWNPLSILFGTLYLEWMPIASCSCPTLFHLDFKLLQVLVVVLPQDNYVKIPNKFGNISRLRYLRLEGNIFGKLPNSIVKLKRLETVDIQKSIRVPSGVWESKQLRHLCYGI